MINIYLMVTHIIYSCDEKFTRGCYYPLISLQIINIILI
uniref:Uncharacterized protein n=1 Tax=Manihot esculenta TaxID=3983 RepID=A0A2C9U5T8_MANES